MKILSHRGYWKKKEEKNSLQAFKRAMEMGFGIETDIRDSLGELVVSHEAPQGEEINFHEFLKIYKAHDLTLAINIKADGLVKPVQRAMEKHGIKDWFVFDMSTPDMRSYLDAGVPVFSRMSEVEKEPIWIEEISGVWLDGFYSHWYDSDLVYRLLNRGLRICVVSPELHGRRHEKCWEDLLPLANHDGLMLCTDFPEQANEVFSEGI